MQARVGEDITTGCGKCKQRTTHVVFAMEGPKIKRVQCKICLSYHNYRPDPDEREAEAESSGSVVRRRREGDEEVATPQNDGGPKERASREPKAPKAAKAPTRRRKEPEAPDWSVLWDQASQGKDPEQMVDYRPDANYEEGALLNHPSFGVGVITKVTPVPERRMQVLFRDGMRTLACRYGS